MTIREHLKRRIRFLFLALLAAWLAVPSTIAVFGTQAATGVGIPWPVFACFPAFAIVMYLFARTSCPACKSSLYGVVGDIALSRGEDSVRSCPDCRADFDAPMQDSG